MSAIQEQIDEYKRRITVMEAFLNGERVFWSMRSWNKEPSVLLTEDFPGKFNWQLQNYKVAPPRISVWAVLLPTRPTEPMLCQHMDEALLEAMTTGGRAVELREVDQ
jgi:hypothetical protein